MTLEDHGIRVEHAMPGRVRLKHHALKGNPELARHLHRQFSTIEGITHVETHPIIGGLVLHYDPHAATSAEFFLKIAAALGKQTPLQIVQKLSRVESASLLYITTLKETTPPWKVKTKLGPLGNCA